MPALNEQRFELTIARLLRAGVSTAAAVVFLGGICYLIGHAHEQPPYRIFQPAAYRSLLGVAKGVRTGDCAAVIQLGLLLLIATPVARVVVSLIAFARQRDRAYVAITCIVLAVLLFSLVY